MEDATSIHNPVSRHCVSGDVFILTPSGPIVRRDGCWTVASGFAVLIVDEPAEWQAVEGEDARMLRENAADALSWSDSTAG